MLAKIDRAKLLQPVRPGDRLDLAVDLTGLTGDAARVTGVARVGARKAATAEIMYALLDASLGGKVLDAAQAVALHDWSDRVWRQLREGS